ncbi:MATE family efflux transporter [Asaccharospora irregularis]|uniref:Probable multidrug resistance protein NorM n=1 Tax=Asaccharospora irregularis DSM 2635 TaxID=1121321 RepID=A0A1M5TEC8_9FIRM|nr:MATE family efflux transporter [Asaccharospora irregularis]SHH48673.1 putative efflux protein, MATE family [Asaccharospora irregularis DSM 2635]
MNNDYLVEKEPLKALIVFSIPIVIGSLFQQFYTMVDSAIVGRFVGERALAAVGASYSLTNIFVCIAIGGGIGASVLVGRYFGAKDYEKMKLSIFTALISFFIISIVLSGFGLLFSRNIMILMNTPSDVLDMSIKYLNIYFFGLPFLFMYNVLSSMFNALGKSRIPLYFLIFSSVFNIALDIFMVKQLNMGVSGVAWATLIAQGISAILTFICFMKEIKYIKTKHTSIFSKLELSNMSKIAIPSILQQSTVSIGMMLVQSVVNSFGSQVLAGFSAAMRIESLCIVPMISIGNALSSYTAQNIGADRPDRVVKGYHASNIMVIFCAIIICIIVELFSNPIISFFLGNEGTSIALKTGQDYLNFMGWFFCLIGFKMAVDGLLRGSGDMKMFTIANFVNLFIRVFLSMTLAPKFGVAMVWFAVPIGWFANWVISFTQYQTGKWEQLNFISYEMKN